MMENYNNRIFIQYTDKRQYNIENEMYFEGISLSYIVLLFIAPIILYMFIKSLKVFKEVKSNRVKC